MYYLGGFSQLKYSTGAKFPSELAEGGFVGWSMVNANNNTLGPIDFRNIRYGEKVSVETICNNLL